MNTEDGQTNVNLTESLIESVHSSQAAQSLIVNQMYLDDEKLTEQERVLVLREIFNQNIRQKQLTRIIKHLTPILDGGHPDSALLVGPTGCGKTVSTLHVLSSLKNVAERKGVNFRYVYVDLTSPKSSFSAFNEVAISLNDTLRRYRKGVPVYLMQNLIAEAIGDYKGFLCLLIDEINNVRQSPDELLTFLGKTLPRKVNCHLMLIMLTNRFDWDKNLDPRIMSFLKKTDIIFEPYSAPDLWEILRLRVDKALDSNRVEDAALRKIAAYASRETGDARKAVELLAKAARIAEKAGGRLTETEVDLALQKIEVDKTEALIKVLALQQRLALESCYLSIRKTKQKTTTGEAYDVYQALCQNQGINTLTQRRFADMLSFLDLYGLINARVISKGRYGNTREISASLPQNLVGRVLTQTYQ